MDIEDMVVVDSDDESLVITANRHGRRSSKESVASISSSVMEDAANVQLTLNIAEPSSATSVPNNRSDYTSPRIAELRSSVDNLGSASASLRELNESPSRASPKVSGMRHSPNSPRKMLVSTPVSGNFDFHGIMSPHHTRRLSSRSASSPRMVLSGVSPKLSPKDAPKVSQRDLLLSSTVPSGSVKAGLKLLPSPPSLPRTPSSRRTVSGSALLPPPPILMSEVNDKLLRMEGPNLLNVKDEEVKPEAMTKTSSKFNDRRSSSPTESVMSGYPLQPSLQNRRAVFEKLQVQVMSNRDNRRSSRDWESDGTLGGDSSTKDSLPTQSEEILETIGRRRTSRRINRRMSDPGLPLNSFWLAQSSSGTTNGEKSVPDMNQEVEETKTTEPAVLTGPNDSLSLGLVRPEPIKVSSVSPATTDDSSTGASHTSPSPVVAAILIVDSKSDSSSPFKRKSLSPSLLKQVEAGEAREKGSPPKPPSRHLSTSVDHPTAATPIHAKAISPPPSATISGAGSQKQAQAEVVAATSSTRSHSIFGSLPVFSKSPGIRSKKYDRSGSMQSPPPTPPVSQQPTSPTRAFAFRLVGGHVNSTASLSPHASSQDTISPRNSAISPHASGGGGFFALKRSSETNLQAAAARSQPGAFPPAHHHGHHHHLPFLHHTARDSSVATTGAPPSGPGGLVRAISADDTSHSVRGTGPATRSTSFTNAFNVTVTGLEEVPIRKSTSTTATIIPPALKEKSPSSSPTTRSKRRASFNLAGFDATIAALKQKFKRKNSSATRDSTSTPNSPLIAMDERRTMPSDSVTSMFSDDSEEGLDARGRRRPGIAGTGSSGRFYLDERRNSEAMDSDYESMSETEGDGAHLLSADEEEEQDLLGIHREGTVEQLLQAIGKISSKKSRQDLFESLFFSAPDFLDPSGEQMTGKVADYVEDSGQLDVLELWLIRFRAVDKLKFYDPSVAARVREVIDAFVDGTEEAMTSNTEAERQRSSSIEEEDEDVGSVVRVDLPTAKEDDSSSSSGSNSSSSSSSGSEGHHSTLRIAHRLLRRLNRSEFLDVAHVNTLTNEWDHDFDEERGGRGLGLKRRKSESDVALSVVTHARMSSGALSTDDDDPDRDDDENGSEANKTGLFRRRATSLPYLLLWNDVAPTRTRREFSTSSVGSFSVRSLSQLNLSPRGGGGGGFAMTSRARDAEDEENCLLGMLAFVVAPPPPPLPSSGSMSSTVTTTTTTGSPPPSAVPAARSETPLVAHQHRRTSSNDHQNFSPQIAFSDQYGDMASLDGMEGGPISPQSEYARRKTEEHVHGKSFSTTRGRQSNLHQSHYKQPSSSSLHTFLSAQHNFGGPRRTAVSSSFSSFIEADTLFVLPERHLRGEIKRYEPRHVAEQLLITMCRTGYFQVTPNALRTVEARKRDEAVQRMVRFFEVLSNWPVTEILMDSKRKASDRIDDFGWFVTLARCSREMGNYHAVFALVGGLQSPLLIWVAEIAHRRHKRQFNVLKRLVRTDNNYRVYHADLSKRNSRLPCIPYLGLLNRTLLTLQCDTPVFLDGGDEHKVINFVRCCRIRKAIFEYLRWQSPSTSHTFPSNGVYIDSCLRRALADSMSRSVLDYRELSSKSSLAKSAFVKSVRQRAFHRARILGHQIVGDE